MIAIRFLDLTHADLGGGRAVRKPFVIGHLTAAGHEEFLALGSSDECGSQAAPHSCIVAELAGFEGDRFGHLPHADTLDEEDFDFYSLDYDLHPPRSSRTPGWHPDADTPTCSGR